MQRPRGPRFLPVRPDEEHRTNRQIRVPQVRLIGLHGEQLGVVATEDALRMAQEGEVDLVEVAPTASPPVCRLLDYGKFRYSKQKKDAEAKKKQHVTQLKELRIRPGTDSHDVERQLKKAQEFLTDGQRVKFTLRFRGREMAHQDLGRGKLTGIANQLGEFGWVEIEPRTEGRVMHLVMAPGQRKRAVLPTGPGAPRPPAAGGGVPQGAAAPSAGGAAPAQGTGAAGAAKEVRPQQPRPA
ncbi:MAG: translation initiation factor IF-3 [Deltaproteobacteria bacterium]|nr:translation initiation factor IF-3 [Deltaproteobacteria bacterium]